MIDISLTYHSTIRLEERLGITTLENQQALAERVWRNGKDIDCFNGEMKKFLANIMHRSENEIIIKVHAKTCYIFTPEARLITAYRIDSTLYNKLMARKHIRRTETCEFYEFEAVAA